MADIHTEIISVSCSVQTGTSVTGIGVISSSSCVSGETLVGCGIVGSESIGGAWVDPSNTNTCNAISNSASSSVSSKARCCLFPDGVIVSSEVIVSYDGDSVSAVCPSDGNNVLTGCQVKYASGSYNQIKGAGAGPNTPNNQASSWIDPDYQCNAYSYSSGDVQSGSLCLQLNPDYELKCTTKSLLTSTNGFGACPADNFMTSCHGYMASDSLNGGLDGYYINDANECFVQKDNHWTQHANAICCQLIKTVKRIECGQKISGSHTAGQIIKYDFTASLSYQNVYLESCESAHDTSLYVYDSSGNQIEATDSQKNHGDQAACGNTWAGDIDIPGGIVDIGSSYSFGVSGYNGVAGEYIVELFCVDALIQCGEKITGNRVANEIVKFSFNAIMDYSFVYLEACDSTHDTFLYVYDSSGNQVQAADDQFNHGDQAGCGNAYAGDIDIPGGNVDRGSSYSFGISGYGTTAGEYTVELFCKRRQYYPGSSLETYENSISSCGSEGMLIAKVSNEDQFNIGQEQCIREHGSGPGCWIGATRQEHEYVGCYIDSVSNRALNDLILGRGYTIESCSFACKGYNFFAVQDGDWCVCENNYDEATQYGASSGCSTAGTGGASRNSLYEQKRVSNYLGCYKDSATRALNDLIIGRSHTVESCAAACTQYNYFAIQSGDWCVCENTWDDAIRYGISTGCSTAGTGGAYANSVYKRTTIWHWDDYSLATGYGFKDNGVARTGEEAWYTGEPNDVSANQDCTNFGKGQDFKWDDLQCDSTTRYPMCEVRYIVGPTVTTYDGAVEWCNSQGLTIATVETSAEFSLGKNVCQKNDEAGNSDGERGCWVGVRDNTIEGQWRWNNGRLARTYGFSSGGSATTGQGPWYSEEPNNANNEDCVHFWYFQDFKWNDIPCSNLNYPLCNSLHTLFGTSSGVDTSNNDDDVINDAVDTSNNIIPATPVDSGSSAWIAETTPTTPPTLPPTSADEICRPAFGRGVGTIPPYCPDGYPEVDGLLCYPDCNAGFNGVGPVCWEICDSDETDDGAFCRVPLITVAKHSYGRGVGIIPTGCPSGHEQNGLLCYPYCKEGYNGVGPVCWDGCPSGYANHPASCYKHLFSWYFKASYGRGWGVIRNECPSYKPELDAGLCYPKCNEGYYGVGPVCWQYCDGVDVGALCEIQSLEIRAKDSYGRGWGRIKNRCYDGQENDAGLCYPVCGDDAVYDGVGPVCWNRNFGTMLGVILGTGAVKTINMAICAALILPTIVANIADFIANPIEKLTGLDLAHFGDCLWPTMALTAAIDSTWSTNQLTVAIEISVSASFGFGIGGFFGVAFNFPTDGGDSLTVYTYNGYCTFFRTDISVGLDASMVIYRSPEDIPGTCSYFSIGADIPGTEIGVGTAYAFNADCETIGTATEIGTGVGAGLSPIDVEFGKCSARPFTNEYHHPGRRRLFESYDEYKNEFYPNDRVLSSLVDAEVNKARRRSLLESEDNCFDLVDSSYYASCDEIRTLHSDDTETIQSTCLKISDCIGYVVDDNTNRATLLSLVGCERSRIEFFDTSSNMNNIPEQFNINTCLNLNSDDQELIELKKNAMSINSKSGNYINKYYTKCPFNIESIIYFDDSSNGNDGHESEWKNVFVFDDSLNVGYPSLFVNFASKSYKLQVGENNVCESEENILEFGEDVELSILIECTGTAVLLLNDIEICSISNDDNDDYTLNEQSMDGKILDLFASDPQYPSSKAYIKSIKASTPKYIWNGNTDGMNENGLVFNTETELEYIFHDRTVAAPYLKLITPYLIQMDININVNKQQSKYNIFETGFEADLTTEITDIYLNYENVGISGDDYRLVLSLSDNEGFIQKAFSDFAITTNTWNTIKILIKETESKVYVNDIEQLTLSANVNTNQPIVPFILAATNRNYPIKGLFKNIQIFNNVDVDDIVSAVSVEENNEYKHVQFPLDNDIINNKNKNYNEYKYYMPKLPIDKNYIFGALFLCIIVVGITICIKQQKIHYQKASTVSDIDSANDVEQKPLHSN